jgi:hypothetical protein
MTDQIRRRKVKESDLYAYFERKEQDEANESLIYVFKLVQCCFIDKLRVIN